jgi:mRNA interferase MazF
MVRYIPQRNHIVWLDFEPTKGKEIGKYRPALILSSQRYNEQTGLVICCPISTSIRGGPTEVPVHGLNMTSVVAASLIHTLSWKERKATFVCEAGEGVMEEVLARIIPLIGVDQVIDRFLD